MRVSVIIAVYKDLEALALILDAMARQTYQNLEVVVAEDNDAPSTKAFLANYSHLDIVHTFHPDVGRTKQASQNRAVCASSGDYLIFIDGDCIPYSTFVAGHVALAGKKRVLSGRRVNLPEDLSTVLRTRELMAEKLEHDYWWFALKQLIWDRESRFEQGVRLNPDGLVYRTLLARRTRNVQLLGCNFSCFKEDFVAINGFDESYGLSILGDDTDLNWRFVDYGCALRSCKNVANVFHLYHRRPIYEYDPSEDLRRFNQRKAAKLFRCEKGLSQYC